MSGRLHQILAIAAALLAIAGPARAEGRSISAMMAVSAVVVANCRVSLTQLDFGTYDPLGSNSTANADAAATMEVACTRSSEVTIEMDQGQNAANGSTSRILSSGGERLTYQIYRDAARTQAWGRGADGLQLVSKGVNTLEQFTVYGRIPPGQEVPAGTYTDLVTATVDF